MDAPPPLQWLHTYVESLERATGSTILLGLKPTVNPLVFTVSLDWSEPPSPKMVQGAWNIFNIFAAKNDCIPDGKIDKTPRQMVFRVIVKRRRGPDREESP